MRIITFGTFDLFHLGHLNIIKRCKYYNNDDDNYLIVGVSSDKLNYDKKQRYPIISEDQRLEIVKNLKRVDEVFIEESLEQKLEYCLKYKADLLIMGDDHLGRFDFLKDSNIDVVYLPRTNDISTTDIINKINKINKIV